jgi:NAD(P)-dependent dehydrogenase (short-subunit alcohol dehydrogenase family)
MGDRLRGKTALITGAASGIGAATAHRFAQEGAAVIVADLIDPSDVARELVDAGGRALAVEADVTSAESLAAAVEAGLGAFGRIDVLFANAGIAGLGTTLECDPSDWSRVIDVNLTGAWLTMRAVLPTMIAQGSGSIILQASVAGIIGVRGIASYSASKAGVIGLARSTAVEVAASGIRVNALAPGTSPTPLVLDTFSTLVGRGGRADEDRTREAMEREQQRYPMGRFGELDEIAAVALFLASDDSSWVTGTVQVVDGGLSAV